jgi:transposase
MFTLPSVVQVFICLQPTDLRKSFDSLAAVVSGVVGQNPLSGHLFVFLNRFRNRIKILNMVMITHERPRIAPGTGSS